MHIPTYMRACMHARTDMGHISREKRLFRYLKRRSSVFSAAPRVKSPGDAISFIKSVKWIRALHIIIHRE